MERAISRSEGEAEQGAGNEVTRRRERLILLIVLLAVVGMVVARLVISSYWPWTNPNADASCGCFRTFPGCLLKPYAGSWARFVIDKVLSLCLVSGIVAAAVAFVLRRGRVLVLTVVAGLFFAAVMNEDVGLVAPHQPCTVIE